MANVQPFPIYVASKGRALSSQLLSRLHVEGLRHTIFIEPQDEVAYRRARTSANIEVIPHNDRGLAYVRQYAHDYARHSQEEWYWMLDDDISSFYQVIDRKAVKVTCYDALMGAQSVFAKLPNVAQAALEYQQFAWSAKKKFSLNSYCDVCVCIHVGRTQGVDFDQEFELKVDRDFTLQILAQGYSTVRCSRWAFSCPANSSNAGGLQQVYQQPEREWRESIQLSQKWGSDVCIVKRKKNGRLDAKINWPIFTNFTYIEI